MAANKKLRVILIDDDDGCILMMRTLLETLDCEVIGAAENGQTGVELFKKEKPDLVLLDLRMPVMSGKEALQIMTDHDSDAKIILLTTVGDQHEIMKYLDTGADYYIRKDNPSDKIKAHLESQLADIRDN